MEIDAARLDGSQTETRLISVKEHVRSAQLRGVKTQLVSENQWAQGNAAPKQASPTGSGTDEGRERVGEGHGSVEVK